MRHPVNDPENDIGVDEAPAGVQGQSPMRELWPVPDLNVIQDCIGLGNFVVLCQLEERLESMSGAKVVFGSDVGAQGLLIPGVGDGERVRLVRGLANSEILISTC